jgi:DNA-binding response OmpR family regulator
MKIIVIDDSLGVVKNIIRAAHEAGFDVFGLTAFGGGEIHDHNGRRDDISPMTAVSDANIVFLDHNMPVNGDKVLAEIREYGKISENVRIFGISTGPQPYVEKQVHHTDASNADFLKRLVETV